MLEQRAIFFYLENERTMDSIENFCDAAKTVNRFCFLGDKLNSSGGCEMAVTARVKIGWVIQGMWIVITWKNFSLKMKGKIYRVIVFKRK